MIDRLSGESESIVEHRRHDEQWTVAIPTVSKVVLVHGAMDRAKSFLPVVEHLPDLRVVEYDRRGYGESLPAGAARVTGAARRRPARTSWAIEPTTVVAHSFGCCRGRLGSDPAPRPVPGTRPLGAAGALDGILATARSGGGSRQWRPRPTRMPSPSGCTHRWWGTRRGGASPKNSRRIGVPRAWPFRATSSSDSVHPFAGRTSRCPACSASALRHGPSAQEAATRLAESLGAELFTIAGAGHSAHVSHPASNLRSSCAAARPFGEADPRRG